MERGSEILRNPLNLLNMSYLGERKRKKRKEKEKEKEKEVGKQQTRLSRERSAN